MRMGQRFGVIIGAMVAAAGLSVAPSAAYDGSLAAGYREFLVPNQAVPNTGGLFKPPHVAGDRDFKGHGPRVETLSWIRETATSVSVIFHMNAVETQKDWTQAMGGTEYNLFQAPPGTCIQYVSIPASKHRETFGYTDNSRAVDSFPSFNGGLVNTWEMVGDTDGNEAGTRTGMRILTNAFIVGVDDCTAARK